MWIILNLKMGVKKMINHYEYNIEDNVFADVFDDYVKIKAIIHEGLFSEDVNPDRWTHTEHGYLVDYYDKIYYVEEI